jgi:hypothetical protein
MKQILNKAIGSLLQKLKRLPVSPRGSPFENDKKKQKRTITFLPPKPYYSGNVGFRLGTPPYT